MFLNAEFCTMYAASEQNRPHVKKEYVGTICYKQQVETWHQTLTFLEGTKELRKYSKVSMFNILKTSLCLKMSNVYISNDIHDNNVIPHFYSIYLLKILITRLIENTVTDYF